MLKDKTIVLGVTGGIAAYKAAELASALKKENADVHVIMTEHACHFISPLTFETLTGNRCITDMFDRDHEYDVEHISLAKAADVIMVAPATANFIAKAAHGIADDMLTTVILAAKCKIMVAPAMNTAMYENAITQDNMDKLRSYGFELIEPDSGLLACGDTGKGKLPDPAYLLECINNEIACDKDMSGLKVLVTAGPTQESIDPVRYITNHSSGKMGYALARACAYRGAEVTLVSGPTGLSVPIGVSRIDVTDAAAMHDAVMEAAPGSDIIFKAAAVADYTPAETSDHKIKKTEGMPDIELVRTADILSDITKIRKGTQIICGFSMETDDVIENSRAKLEKKGIDMICANSLRTEGAGFAGDTNVVTIITDRHSIELGKMSKFDTAQRIIDVALEMRKEKFAAV